MDITKINEKIVEAIQIIITQAINGIPFEYHQNGKVDSIVSPMECKVLMNNTVFTVDNPKAISLVVGDIVSVIINNKYDQNKFVDFKYQGGDVH